MGLLDIEQAIITSLDTVTTNYIAGQEPWNKNLDGFVIAEKETEIGIYQTDWEKWHGIYREVPELKAQIDTLCRWIIGRKIKALDKRTEEAIERIRGNGHETFRQIMLNLKRTSKICGDAFAEKIKDKAKRLINLKVLDSGTIRTVSNRQGIIVKFEQLNKKPTGETTSTKDLEVINSWSQEDGSINDVFHIMNNRIGDEIHGIPESECLQKMIKMKWQTMLDHQTVIHRYGKPTHFYEVDTDDETEMANIKTKIDNAIKKFDNVIVPKGTLNQVQTVKVAQLSNLDPMPWLKFIRTSFNSVTNVPDVVQGESRESATQAGELNVISYIAKVIMEQIEFEEDIMAQLGLNIQFERPKELETEQKGGANNEERKRTQGNNRNPD